MQNARAKLRDFMARWGDVLQVVTGAILMCVCVAVVVIAIQIRNTSNDTQVTATVSCQRTVLFSPFIYNFFRDNNVLPRDVVIDGKHHDLLAEYKSTIPTTCHITK